MSPAASIHRILRNTLSACKVHSISCICIVVISVVPNQWPQFSRVRVGWSLSIYTCPWFSQLRDSVNFVIRALRYFFLVFFLCCIIFKNNLISLTVSIVCVLTMKINVIASFCPISYQIIGPVCGTDGVTYPSMCDLEAARLIDDSLDIALLKPCNNYCNEKWDPICGTDMVTYANVCMFEHGVKDNENLRVLHPGQCLTPLGDDAKIKRNVIDPNEMRQYYYLT